MTIVETVMMKRIAILLTGVLAGVASCGEMEDENVTGTETEVDSEAMTINIATSISGGIESAEATATRATGEEFEDGDKIGVYVVDLDGTGAGTGTSTGAGSGAGTLKNSGNRADNVRFTFDKGKGAWVPSQEIYWKDMKTHIDVYGYYPYTTTVSDVNNLTFTVRKDQSEGADNGGQAGYDASDLLWGKAEDVAPTGKVIMLPFTHRLSKVHVSLEKGSGFKDDEWTAAAKEVIILNTNRIASIDIATGAVIASGNDRETGIIPIKDGDSFNAIVVPQSIPSGTTFISITVAGVSYKFTLNEILRLSSSKQYNFTIEVNKRGEGDFEFIPKINGISEWESDDTQRDLSTREYVVVNVDVPGTLDECIQAAGKDPTSIKNLKLTGNVNARDFAFIKAKMNSLQAINMKEVQIKKCENGDLNGLGVSYKGGMDDELPFGAFSEEVDLLHVVLPDRLKVIGEGAFLGSGISGPLVIPEGVIEIKNSAFSRCSSIGRLSLPSTLVKIGSYAFFYSSISETLSLPSALEYIGDYAFDNCTSLYGDLHLPDNLTYIGRGAFITCQNLTGSLTIPKGINEIQGAVFSECSSMDGTLKLHDGITKIGADAFNGCCFKGELILPKNLTVIEKGAFADCTFNGTLSLPDKLVKIGNGAFEGNDRLTGILYFPESLISLGTSVFGGCCNLEGIVLPENFDFLPSGTFNGCYGLNKIVCKNEIPPQVAPDAFLGVPKDNFTVEVPESSVHQYQVSDGWSDFKRISAYRNLVITPRVATALNTKATRTLTLRADEKWFVESQPDWVRLSQTEGSGKATLSVTFTQMPEGASREGDIVIKLRDKDYSTVCHVTQYDYDYAEDQIITIQKALKGDGVNLMFLGDGYSAKDIHEGAMERDISAAVEHFFSVEPYKSYRKYFNVYTGVAVSQESGIGGVNTIIHNRFNTTSRDIGTIGCRTEYDYQKIFEYAAKAPSISKDNIGKTLVVMVLNTSEYDGTTYMFDDSSAISFCPVGEGCNGDDFRGMILHEAGGHGFGKLADEDIRFNGFATSDAINAISIARARGWYENISTTSNTDRVPWSHLINHEKYRSIVDVFEGGFSYTRGVYRSEYNSCMNNSIPYFSTISRESIVRRILKYAGEEFDFSDFVDKDRIVNAPETATGNAVSSLQAGRAKTHHHNSPVFMDSNISER